MRLGNWRLVRVAPVAFGRGFGVCLPNNSHFEKFSLDNYIPRWDVHGMKAIVYATRAQAALAKHRSAAKAILAKIERYAKTGAGDVKPLVGRSGKRLRAGDFRVLFTEDETSIRVTDIGHRASIYE
jgi:mRNA interferase RelE/StbE